MTRETYEIETRTGAVQAPTTREPYRNPSYPKRDHFSERSILEEALRTVEQRIESARHQIDSDRDLSANAEAVRLYHQLLGIRDQIAECTRASLSRPASSTTKTRNASSRPRARSIASGSNGKKKATDPEIEAVTKSRAAIPGLTFPSEINPQNSRSHAPRGNGRIAAPRRVHRQPREVVSDSFTSRVPHPWRAVPAGSSSAPLTPRLERGAMGSRRLSFTDCQRCPAAAPHPSAILNSRHPGPIPTSFPCLSFRLRSLTFVTSVTFFSNFFASL